MSLPAGYDAPLAARLCLLSDLAYDCFRKDRLNPEGAVCHENFAFIVRVENGCILAAFQGSNDATDWLKINANAVIKAPEDDPNFRPVHAGFWRAVQSIIDLLRVELHKHPSMPIHLGGHSLGGGIAVPMAVRLIEMGYNVASVYGFGAPPVGAVKFYNYYARFNIPTFLLVYLRDGVPHLQPKGVHVAKLTYLDERAYPLEKRPSFSWLRFWKWSAWRDDHDSQNYVTVTAKIADRVTGAM